MATEARRNIIEERYAKRRAALAAGWASTKSYERKAAEFDRIIAAHAIPTGARVLELGCGAGNTTLYAAR